MTTLSYGLVSGAVLGAVAIGPMFRMTFADKRAAISAAFIERLSIGLVIALVSVPWPGWVTGITFGLLLSLPSALITGARVPILVLGGLGGLVIGLVLPYAVH
jgi:hypothetical protein